MITRALARARALIAAGAQRRKSPRSGSTQLSRSPAAAFGGPPRADQGRGQAARPQGIRERCHHVDLDKAPVNGRGMIDYQVDFHPASGRAGTGNGILFYQVLSRGNKQRTAAAWSRRRRTAALNDRPRATTSATDSCSSVATASSGQDGKRTLQNPARPWAPGFNGHGGRRGGAPHPRGDAGRQAHPRRDRYLQTQLSRGVS